MGQTYGRLHEFLDLGTLSEVERRKVLLSLEGQDPEVETDDEAKDAADGGHPATNLEPSSRRGDDTGNCEEESDEDEDGIHDTSC